MNDLRFACRQLLKNPGFTAVAGLTLALGIGATTTVFSIVDGVVLKPLPYEQPGQLVQVWEAAAPGERNSVSPGAFLDWRRNSTVFEDLSIWRETDMNLTGDGQPERIKGLAMSASGLRILRARPFLGRIFSPEEDQPGRDKVVVLAHGFWQRRFGGDINIVGQRLQLSDQSYVVIGVLPPRFLSVDKAEFVVPTAIASSDAEKREVHWLDVIGRLKPATTVEQAQAEMSAVAARLRPIYPAYKKDWGVTLVPMHEQITGNIKPTLAMLSGAVGFVLLIACANVANLLLARASGRRREMAVRVALGAGRRRIIRQLLTESVLLSLFGASLGILLAYCSIGAVRNLESVNLPRAHELGIDLRILAFAVIVALLAGVAFGLVPALQASRPNLNDALKEEARSAGTGRKGLFRNGLIVTEIALSLVLLVGAALLVNSFVRLSSVPSGVNPENVLTMQITLPEKKYPDQASRAAFFDRLVDKIRTLPGIDVAGVIGTSPLAGWSNNTTFTVAGRPDQPPMGHVADMDFCTPDFFKAAGIPLRKGRFFEARDKAGAPGVVIINEAMAREHFRDQEPLGQRIHLEAFTGKVDTGWEIVGIVGDVLNVAKAKMPGPAFIVRRRLVSWTWVRMERWSSALARRRWYWRRACAKPCLRWIRTSPWRTFELWRTSCPLRWRGGGSS